MAKTKYKLPKIEDLLDAGVHFGHQVRRWNPRMEKYIFSVKKNIHVIDLEDSVKGLKSTCEFLNKVASEGGQIILVGTKRQARDIVQLEAKRSGALYITERWLGGTITNFRMIRKSIDRLLELTRKREAGELARYTKKERLLIDREIEKLENSVGGISSLKGKPDAVFIVDVRREKTAVAEANKFGVPVAALVDTNSDPTGVDFVVPGNDDAIKSIALILKAVADSIEAGYKDFAEASKKPVKKEDKVEFAKDEKPEEVEEKVEVTATAAESDAVEAAKEEEVEIAEDEVIEVAKEEKPEEKSKETKKKKTKKIEKKPATKKKS